MAQTSRPATADDLKRIVRALNEAGARYLRVGAHALFAHGYQRATIDIDLLVGGTEANGRKVRQEVVDLDGVPVHTVSLEGLLLTKQSQRPQDIQDAIVLRRAIEADA